MNYYRQQSLSPSMKAVFILVLTALFFFISQVKAATYAPPANGSCTPPMNWAPMSGAKGPGVNEVSE